MGDEVTFGPFRLDLDRRVLLRDGSRVPLGGRALDLLCVLAAARGGLVTKDSLMDQVWPGLAVEENNIQVQVSSLRRALREAGWTPDLISTVPGRGYRFVAPATDEERERSWRGNLPAPSELLIGRKSELADLARLVSDHRLVTLVGAGGSGKTRLALQLGIDLRNGFADGVWLAELAPLAKPELLGETVAALFNVSLQGDQPATKVIGDFLADRQLLLILDNCEHMIMSAAQFAVAVLAACPEVKVIATSREALAIPSEYVYETPLLSTPQAGEVTAEQALEHSAVQLLVARASSTSRRLALTDAIAPTIAAICRKLDGLPLAIELAAARLKLLSPAEVLAHLDDCLNLLTAGSRTALPRHQTLRAVIAWSHALLSESEQALLRRLGVFAGSFSLRAAAAVTAGPPIAPGDALGLLGLLVDKSLVIPIPDTAPTRYRLLETTRAYALERLTESGETGYWHRLCAYMADRFLEAEQAWPTSATSEWLGTLEPELDNLRTALTWAFEQEGDAEFGLQLVSRTHWFWCELPLLREQRRWFELAAGFIADTTPPGIEGRIHLVLGWDPYFGDHSRLPRARQAELLFRLSGEPLMLAQALGHAGRAASRYRDAGEAIACFDEALALLRPFGPTKLLALLLLSQATAYKHAGNVTAARVHALQGQELAAKVGDIQTRDMCGVQLASIAFEAGDLAGAIAIARASVEKCRRSPFMRNHFVAVQWLAGFLLLSGDMEAAREAALEAFTLSRALGNVNLMDSIDQLALLAAVQGNASVAAQLCGFASAYGCRHEINRYRISLAVRERLMRYLEELPPDRRTQWMAEGAAWSEDALTSASRSIRQWL
jgi:predicted ATPase/DNA-binding winged helix-turn-helix (wHTH) protein